jgi:ribose transport system substrate-binding protein
MPRSHLFSCIWLAMLLLALPQAILAQNQGGRLAYLVSDTRIPFWTIMARGIEHKVQELNYQLDIYSAHNEPRRELENTVKALSSGVDGLIVSPTTSSACATILKLARQAGVPVVIADIGTDGGDYVSYISSDNREGAYQIGKVLAQHLQQRGWQEGRVGIIAIPQKRLNGQARTAGFMQAMHEAGVVGATIRQQVDFSYAETYRYSRELIDLFTDLRAIWLQGSDRYQAALDAIRDSGRDQEILLVTFDAEPIFLDLIPQGRLVGAAMQQPYLMGLRGVEILHDHLNGIPVEKHLQLPILAISADNIVHELPLIKRNVLGITD